MKKAILTLSVGLFICLVSKSHAVLEHHWKLDALNGSSQFADSVGTNHGTRVGDAALDSAEKKIGSGAAVFDGDGDYVDVGLQEKVGESALTITAWVNPNTIVGTDSIFGNSISGNAEYVMRLDSGKLRAAIYTDVGWNITVNDSTPLQTNGWSHVAMVYDGTSLVRYINGISSGATLVTTGSEISREGASDKNATIGTKGAGGTEYFDGKIDEVRVYDEVLSASEIQELSRGLMHHWPLDELNASTKFVDTTGPLAGSLVNTANLDTGTKKIGAGSATFLANEDVVDVGRFEPGGQAQLTLSAWVNPTDVTGTDSKPIFGNDNGSDKDFFIRLGGPDVGARVYTTDSGGVSNTWTTTLDDPVAALTWTHVVFVWNGSLANNKLIMYFNGTAHAINNSVPGDTFGQVDDNVAPSLAGIGAAKSTGGTSFKGNIDDVSIRFDALSVDEVVCLYDVGNTLGYDASDFDQLKQVHEEQLTSAVIDGTTWVRAEGLTGSAGLNGGNPSAYTLVMDDSSNTGLKQPPRGTVVSIK